jgi:hypothetical protein
MDFISFASWTGMPSLFETYFDTWHRIRQQDKAYSNIKILLYHWLLIYVHMSKPTGGRRPCDINCSKFFPAPFWSHNQKVAWVSLLYLPPKSNADYLPINSTMILSQSLVSDIDTITGIHIIMLGYTYINQQYYSTVGISMYDSILYYSSSTVYYQY